MCTVFFSGYFGNNLYANVEVLMNCRIIAEALLNSCCLFV